MIGIYMIKSSLSENVYIGQSVNIKTRFNLHLTNLRNNKHHSIHLQRAWNLYGEKSFTFEVVEECEKDELTRKEQAWMDEYSGRLYNSSPAAGSVTGYKHTAEAKEKIAASKRGIPRHPDVTKKRLETMKGFKHTDESRRKMIKPIDPIALAKWKETL